MQPSWGPGARPAVARAGLASVVRQARFRPLAVTAPVDPASPPPCGAPTEHLRRLSTAHWVKSSRFAWLVAGCMGPVRATALHGQQVLECPWRASRLCAKNSVRPDRHVWGAYQCFWHSAPVSLDCRAVTQGQRAGNPGSANCRSRHPTRTRSGRASWSPLLLHRRALGKREYCLPGCPVRRNGQEYWTA